MQFDWGYTSQTSSMPPMWMIGTSQKWVLRKWWRCFASDILRRHSKKQTDWQCRCKERAMRSYWEHGNRKVILQLQHFHRIILQLQHLRCVILLQRRLLSSCSFPASSCTTCNSFARTFWWEVHSMSLLTRVLVIVLPAFSFNSPHDEIRAAR